MSLTQTEPLTIEDAVMMALDEALEAAGYRDSARQPCEADLQAAMLDALWNDDATLQQAARSAVERCAPVLMREEEECRCGFF